VADTDARLAERFELVESALDAAGPFALGAQPSLADCGFTATLIWRDRLAPALGLRAAPGQRLARLLAAMESEPRLAAECADYRRLVGAWLASRA
jgi:glutathione S-transferase